MTAVIAFAIGAVALVIGGGIGWVVAMRRAGVVPVDDPPQAPLAAPIAAPDGEIRAPMRPEAEAPTGDGRMTKGTLLNLILKVSHTAVAVVDEHRDVVFYNDRAEELSLIRSELLEDQAWEASQRVLLGSEQDSVAFEFSPPLSASGFVTTGRGSGRNVESVRCLARLVTDGNERYAVVYGEDDSENQRMEATRRDFVANVSHELKTPVGAIGLLTEALLESVDDAESVRHFGQRVLSESTRMGHMVNELIALSRLQGAEKLPDLEAVSVDELVDSAVHAAQASAEAHNIDLRTDDASHLHIHGDFTLLLTALNNLVANAIAYSPNGSQVTISRRRSYVAGTAMASIAVTDRGIGIAPHDQKRVFERFFRVDKARSRVTGGTGLGLAIVKHVAANHDGDVALWSKSGTGSTFTLSIPIDAAVQPSSEQDWSTDRVTPQKEELSR